MKLPWPTRAPKIAELNLNQNLAVQAFYLPPIGDAHLNIKISRNTSFGILISIIIHALILFFVLPQLIKPNSVFPRLKH